LKAGGGTLAFGTAAGALKVGGGTFAFGTAAESCGGVCAPAGCGGGAEADGAAAEEYGPPGADIGSSCILAAGTDAMHGCGIRGADGTAGAVPFGAQAGEQIAGVCKGGTAFGFTAGGAALNGDCTCDSCESVSRKCGGGGFAVGSCVD